MPKYIKQKERGIKLSALYAARDIIHIASVRRAALAIPLLFLLAIIVRFGFDPPPAGGGFTTNAPDSMWNSSETGCGTDSNVLMCEDFERKANGSTPGDWYSLNCDNANAAGGKNSQSKGWCGSIFANPITPAGAVDCAVSVGAFGDCAATSGTLDGSIGGRNMADHDFPGKQEYQEIYVRYYRKTSAGYVWSGQKSLTVNRCSTCPNSGGIFWTDFGFNIGIGTPSSSPTDLLWTNNHAENQIFSQNISVQNETSGNWYFYEMHIKLDTPGNNDGVLEMWVNECGPSLPGSCTGSPTKRANYTAFSWGNSGGGEGIGNLWWENWGNSGDSEGSTGTEWYDQIKVSRVGPIGFYTGN